MSINWDNKYGTKPSGWDSLDRATQEAWIKSLASNTRADRRGGLNIAKETFEFDNYIGVIERLNTALEKATSSMSNMGAFFVRDGPMSIGLQEVAKQSEIWFASADKGISAYRTLSETLTGFNQLANSSNKAAKELTIDLAKQATVLKELGLNTRDFARNLDLAIYTFGASKQQVKDFNIELTEMADTFDKLPSAVSRSFQLIAKNMAFDLSKVKEEFKAFERMSIGTGIDSARLATQFGDRLDTIAGSTQQAAMLNQLLGTNKFSGNQLLMTPPSERMKIIVDALRDPNSVVMKALTQGDQMTKYFARKSVAEAISTDVDFQRRLMETEDPEQLLKIIESKDVTEAERQAAKEKLGPKGALRQVAKDTTKEDIDRVRRLGSASDTTATRLEKLKNTVIRTQLDLVDGAMLFRRGMGLDTLLNRPTEAPSAEQAGVLQKTVTGQLGFGSDPRVIGNRGAMTIAQAAPAFSKRYAEAINAGLITDRQLQALNGALKQFNNNPTKSNRQSVLSLMASQLRNVEGDALTRATPMRSVEALEKVPEAGGIRSRMLRSLQERQRQEMDPTRVQKLDELEALLRKDPAQLTEPEKTKKNQLQKELGLATPTAPTSIPVSPRRPPAKEDVFKSPPGAGPLTSNFQLESSFASNQKPVTLVFNAPSSVVPQTYEFEMDLNQLLSKLSPAVASMFMGSGRAAVPAGALDEKYNLTLSTKMDTKKAET